MKLHAPKRPPHPYPALDVSDVCFMSGACLLRNLAGRPFPTKYHDPDKEKEFQRADGEICKAAGEPFPDGTRFTRVQPPHPHGLVGYFARLMHLNAADACDELAMNPFVSSATPFEFIFSCHSDHLAIARIAPGTDVEGPAMRVAVLEETLSRRLNFAWDSSLGFLTSSPDSVGTGFKAFRMMHLEGLHEIGELEASLHGLAAMRIKVRSVELDGFNGAGHIFMLSNGRTLGLSESELLAGFQAATDALAEQEINARMRLAGELNIVLSDTVRRAIAIMQNCRMISTTEALDVLSPVRMAASMGFVSGASLEELDRAMLGISPDSGEAAGMTPDECDDADAARATELRPLAMRLAPNVRGRRSLQ